MLIVLNVGTAQTQTTNEHAAPRGVQRDNTRTHHEALDILHPRLLDALPEEQHANACPYYEEHAERDGNEPVERREVDGTAKHDVQRGRVDDEHAEACTGQDPQEVVVVADDGLSKREPELRLHREDLQGTTHEQQPY